MRRVPCFVFAFASILACGTSHTAEDGSVDSARVDLGEDDGGSDSATGEDARPDADSSGCMYATDCRLVPASCCGDCGAHTRDDIASVHVDDLSVHREMACPDAIACPPCYTAPDPALVATCEEGSCGYVDLYDPDRGHTSEFTACSDDSDCVLRVIDCCPCGADITLERLVAIRADHLGAFAELVCEPDTACLECEPNYAPFFTWCGGDTPDAPKRCRVDLVGE